MERDGWREELRVVLDAALTKSTDLGDGETEAELRWHLGVLLHLQARYAEAGHLEASATQYERLGSRRNQARGLARLASVARWQRRLDEAEHLVCVARELLCAGDPEHAYLLSVQGQAALDRHEWLSAAACFEQALTLATTSQDQRMVAWGMGQSGYGDVEARSPSRRDPMLPRGDLGVFGSKRSRASGRGAHGSGNYVRIVQ